MQCCWERCFCMNPKNVAYETQKNLVGRPETTCLSVNDINSQVNSSLAAAYRPETAQKKQNMLEEFVLTLTKKLTDINRCLTDPANRCSTDSISHTLHIQS